MYAALLSRSLQRPAALTRTVSARSHLQHGSAFTVLAAARPTNSSIWQVVLAVPSNSPAQRSIHTSTRLRAGAGAGATDGGAKQSKQDTKAEEEEFADEQIDVNEPMVAKISRYLWNTIKITAGLGIFGVVMYAGYTIVTTLLPVGASSNAIMRRASDIITHDPEVHAAFGVSKTYGLDPGGRAEGRRYFVPEYKYEDPLSGDKYHRVKFNLEGERGKKAWVYAEVEEGSHDFRYVLVVSKDGSRVVSVVDRRPPRMTKEDRMSRVTSLIQDAGWAFYTDNDIDEKEQSKVLADYWLKVKCVRCDAQPGRCEGDGVTTTPAWKTSSGVQKGLRDLAELERMVQPLQREKDGKGKKGWFSFLS